MKLPHKDIGMFNVAPDHIGLLLRQIQWFLHHQANQRRHFRPDEPLPIKQRSISDGFSVSVM